MGKRLANGGLVLLAQHLDHGSRRDGFLRQVDERFHNGSQLFLIHPGLASSTSSSPVGAARGSPAQLETFLMLSTKLELTNSENSEHLLSDGAEINKMLNALIESLSTRHSPLTTLLTTLH